MMCAGMLHRSSGRNNFESTPTPNATPSLPPPPPPGMMHLSSGRQNFTSPPLGPAPPPPPPPPLSHYSHSLSSLPPPPPPGMMHLSSGRRNYGSAIVTPQEDELSSKSRDELEAMVRNLKTQLAEKEEKKNE